MKFKNTEVYGFKNALRGMRNPMNSWDKSDSKSLYPATIDCFEIDDYEPELLVYYENATLDDVINTNTGIIHFLETLRQHYVETKDKRYWKELIRWLPESWLQTRTVTMSYENLYTMIRQRKNHKLSEWAVGFINWARTLPYAQELIFIDEVEE